MGTCEGCANAVVWYDICGVPSIAVCRYLKREVPVATDVRCDKYLRVPKQQ